MDGTERLWLVSDAKRSPKEEYHIKSRDTHAIVVLPSLLVVCWPSSIPVHSIKLAGGYKHWSGTLRHRTRHTHTQILQNARQSSGQIVETNAHNKTKDNQRSLPPPSWIFPGELLREHHPSLPPVLSITVCVCVFLRASNTVDCWLNFLPLVTGRFQNDFNWLILCRFDKLESISICWSAVKFRWENFWILWRDEDIVKNTIDISLVFCCWTETKKCRRVNERKSQSIGKMHKTQKRHWHEKIKRETTETKKSDKSFCVLCVCCYIIRHSVRIYNRHGNRKRAEREREF